MTVEEIVVGSFVRSIRLIWGLAFVFWLGIASGGGLSRAQPFTEVARGSDDTNPVDISDEEMAEHAVAIFAGIQNQDARAESGRLYYVLVYLIVAPDGHVHSVEPIDAPGPLFDQASSVARTWKFQPFVREGRPVFAKVKGFVEERPAERRPETGGEFPAIKNWKSLRIRLSRTPCFGRCAAYSVEIRGDGTVVYEGRSFVAVTGRHVSRISHDATRELVAAFEAAQFFRTFDVYFQRVSDNALVRTTIAFDRHKKSVTDYVGLDVGMPSEIADLGLAIQRIAGIYKWIRPTADTLSGLATENYFKKRETDRSLLVSLIGAGAGPQMVRDAIRMGADPDGGIAAKFRGRQARSPLLEAVRKRDREIVQILLDAGAGQKDRRTMTAPLMAALERGDADLAEALLSAGAAGKSRQDRDEALLAAARLGSVSLIKTLVQRGADPNYAASGRGTVLILATQSGSPEAVTTILAARSKVEAVDSKGWTALQHAIDGWYLSRDMPQTVNVLLEAGARWWTKWENVHERYCQDETGERCVFLTKWMNAHPESFDR